MKITNHLRATVEPVPIDMNYIEYNTSFEADVLTFLNARDKNWVFENATDYHTSIEGPVNNWNGFVMLQYPEFKKWEPFCTF